MGALFELPKPEIKAGSTVMYAVALIFIYTVPTISHLIDYPVYIFEPMRIMLILSIAHTGKWNSILIAATLPAFSYIISDHPSLLHSFLMTGELLINALLFFLIIKKISNIFTAIAVSIIASKLFYFSGKLILLQASLITGALVTTPFTVQIFNIVVLSGYLYFFNTRNFSKNDKGVSVA